MNKIEDLGIFWSLYAELIYYTIYPLLIIIKNKIGFIKLIVATILLGYIAILFYPYKSWQNFVDLGNGLTWLIGLPSWLVGVILAEQTPTMLKSAPITMNSLIVYRIIVFLTSVILSIAKFHLGINYTVSFIFFAILIYFWLSKEIIFYTVHTPSKLLEWSRTWSYSLYICHPIAATLLFRAGLNFSFPYISWIITMIIVFLFSYLFFLLVEKPSPILVKKLHWPALEQQPLENTTI